MFKGLLKKVWTSSRNSWEPQIIKLGSKNMRKIKIVQKSCLLAMVKADSLRDTPKERWSARRQFQLQPPYLPKVPLRPFSSA